MKRPQSSLTLFYSLALTIQTSGPRGLPTEGLRRALVKHVPRLTLDKLLGVLVQSRLVRESDGRLIWSGPS